MRWVLLAIILVAAAALPAAAQDDWDDDWGEDEELPVEIHGYVEAAGGSRVVNDPANSDDFVLGEARFRLDLAHYTDKADFSFKGDFIADAVTNETLIDIRRAWLLWRAGTSLELSAGRQVLTWGTGDLLFLNDLFPKDFVSFFIGRDDEFLKAPSNSLKFSSFARAANLDLVWTPIFASDRYITGERLSFYNAMAGGKVSAETMGAPFEAAAPDKTIENSEVAGRLYRTAGSYELAAYGYWGFFKQPSAFDATDSVTTFAPLSVWGASVRGNLLGGIANIEGAYYDSRDDRDGTDALIRNSEVRGLAGYERELVANFMLGLQYYLEWLQNYDALTANSLSPSDEPNETRQMLTARLTWRLMQQTLTLSLFGYYAFEDGDSYWRPVISRKFSDAVTMTAGANVMTGDAETFFGQLEDNTNIYLRFRYSF